MKTIAPLLIVLFASLCAPPSARADVLTVGAASSLTNVMNELGREYTSRNPQTTVRFTFAASGALQQQIQQGAPIDVFASASRKEMDALIDAGAIGKGTSVGFAGNRLVLITPTDSPVKRWDDLRSVKRFAISDPGAVPSGRYAKETLIQRGLWTAIEKRAIYGQNVRQTLAYVASGDVDAGIVFATDALQEGRVKRADIAESGKDHTPIVYPAAVVIRSRNRETARRFVQFLQSREARGILRRFGFTLPLKPPF